MSNTPAKGGGRGRDHGLPVGPQNETGQRDANLRDGNVTVEGPRIVHDGKNPGRQRVAVLRQAPQAAATSAHRSELSSYIQGVRQDQERDDRRSEQHGAIVQEN